MDELNIKLTRGVNMKPTASRKAKDYGLKNLNEMVAMTGESRQSLVNWFNLRPQRFELLLIGCIVKKMETHKEVKEVGEI